MGIGLPGLTPRAVIWITPAGFAIVAGTVIGMCQPCIVHPSNCSAPSECW